MLTYFFNHDVLASGLKDELDDRFGFKVIARPDAGFSHYMPAEFRGTAKDIGKALAANQTTLITVRLHRFIDQGVFSLRDQSLGFDKIRLMTNNPTKIDALERAGIDVVDRIPLVVRPGAHNEHYLETKRRRMSHKL